VFAGSPALGARCARHPERLAHDVCARCGSYACAQCHRLADNGLDYCIACLTRLDIPASRADRFIANLVDQAAVWLPVTAGFILQLIIAQAERRLRMLDAFPILLGALATLGVLAYQLYLVAESGQSLGKRMRNIRTVRMDGSPVTLGRVVVLRNVVPGLINAACNIFGLVDALFIYNPDRRCLHDVLADTKVVKVNPEAEG
jgi:uncharacterized RDD family membrane protein YckC